MKQIPLTRGKVAIVDDDVYDYLVQWKWHANRDGYALRKPGRQTVFMHRLIIQAPAGMEVDHINGNRLDNRCANLRLCTRAENLRNTKARPGNRSGYKGVSWSKQNKKWWARIVINGRFVNIGHFYSAEDAAIAYNQAALEHFGTFAYFNDVPNWQSRAPVRHVKEALLRRSNTSGYRGVSFDKRDRKWVAYIGFEGRQIRIGYFNSAEEAARAYDQKAKELFGKFARTNFEI